MMAICDGDVLMYNEFLRSPVDAYLIALDNFVRKLKPAESKNNLPPQVMKVPK